MGQAQPLIQVSTDTTGFEPVITSDGNRILSRGSALVDGQSFAVLQLFTAPFDERDQLFVLPDDTTRFLSGSVISGDGRTAVMPVTDEPSNQIPLFVVTLWKIDVLSGQAQPIILPLDPSQSMIFGEFSQLNHDGSRVAFSLWTDSANRHTTMVYDFNDDSLIIPADWPNSPVADLDCWSPRISGDGRVLVSQCSMPPGQMLGADGSVYRFDLQTQATTLLSATGGLPVISDDGTVAGYSEVVAGEVSFVIADLQTQERLRLSVPGTGEIVHAASVVMSGNGRFVAFRSDTGSLMPEDTGLQANVFRYDRLTNRFDIVSLANDGSIPNDSCGPMSNLPLMPPRLDGMERYRALSITPDGRNIALYCSATNLIDGVTDPGLFLWRGPAPAPVAVPTLTPVGLIVLVSLIIGLWVSRRRSEPAQ